MKIQGFQKTGLLLATAIAVVFPTVTFGQTTPASDSAPPVTVTTTAPALSPAASQVLLLSQAKISDSTIITYVQNSGSVYGLDASQIVYLKQQGVSDVVLNAMLNQRSALAATPMPQTPPGNSVVAEPTATVAQPTTPAPNVVVVPDTQTYYYDNWAYPYYYSYPYYGWPVVYWGWGGGWRGGFHDHDGYRGGFGGGGFHGGVSGGFHGGGGFSGGFHGGGGGFHH